MTPVSQPTHSVQADVEVVLRQQLVASFHDERVHATFEKIFADIPANLRNTKPEGQPFTLWRLLVHIRLCVVDFLDACRIPGYVEPPVPEGFWPDENATADNAAWDADLAGYHAAMREFEALLLDPATDLFSPIPGSDGRTILRQALACIDHNAYHLGQALLVRRLLSNWTD
ncbi:MAG TPA: DinB family protein [Acidobacteriaceae bacterium]|nr:DinB family protein [Acidobacteriaceae bacterium]